MKKIIDFVMWLERDAPDAVVALAVVLTFVLGFLYVALLFVQIISGGAYIITIGVPIVFAAYVIVWFYMNRSIEGGEDDE